MKHPQICRKMLIALAQHPMGLTKAQILLHAGYASSGPVSTSFADLAKFGYVHKSDDGRSLRISTAGESELGDYEELPTGDDLREYLLNGSKLDKLEKALLRAVTDAYPDDITKGEILERAKYASSGPVSTAFAKLVRYGYVKANGASRLVASEALFDG